jgi:hypothetical protein
MGLANPLIQWVPVAYTPGVKRPRREANNLPQSIVEVRKMWIYTSTSSNTYVV